MAMEKSWVSLVCEIGGTRVDHNGVRSTLCFSRDGVYVAVSSTSWYIPCSCSNGNISRDGVPSRILPVMITHFLRTGCGRGGGLSTEF